MGTRTVLADGGEPLFDFPAGPADERERLEDLDALRGVHDAIRIKGGHASDFVAPAEALGKLDHVLVLA